MARDLFGDVTRPFNGVGARSRLTVPLSIAAHSAAVVALVVVPLLATDALPALREGISYTTVTPVVPPEPPRPRVARMTSHTSPDTSARKPYFTPSYRARFDEASASAMI